MGVREWCLVFALMPVAAFAGENPLGMSFVETKDLKLIYFDPLGYLVPHTVRTFTNSQEWQRMMFGWTPSEPTIVLLKDFSDYASAATLAAPHSRLAARSRRPAMPTCRAISITQP